MVFIPAAIWECRQTQQGLSWTAEQKFSIKKSTMTVVLGANFFPRPALFCVQPHSALYTYYTLGKPVALIEALKLDFSLMANKKEFHRLRKLFDFMLLHALIHRHRCVYERAEAYIRILSVLFHQHENSVPPPFSLSLFVNTRSLGAIRTLYSNSPVCSF